MIVRPLTTTLLASLMLLGSACDKDESKTEAPKAEPAAVAEAVPAETATPAETETPSAAEGTIESLMASYEACRALLAADKGDGVADCAKKVSASATALGATAADNAKPHLEAMSTAADALGALPADGLDKLRPAFGEVSKSVVALIGVTPTIAGDFHVFECPMAEGYQRWVQPNATLENPYMGTKMLSCGSEVSKGKGGHDHGNDGHDHGGGGHDHDDKHEHGKKHKH